MKKTLAAIARDRRCQALMSLMRKGQSAARRGMGRLRRGVAGDIPEGPGRSAARENIFADI